MTIQDLQYFLAVYEQRSMTKAADKLFISQPAVSIAVRNLEKEFNTSLFVRNTPLEPTAEGDKLYALAVKFLHSYENLRMEMNNGEYEKPLRIGVSMIVNQLLPADWLNTGNKVSFLGFYDSDFLTQSVLNNTLDLAIVLTVGKFHHAQLRAKTILDTTVSLYTTKENKLSSFKKLRPDQVNNQQVIAFSERAMVEDEYAGIMEKILGDDAHLKVSFYSVNLLNIEKSIAERLLKKKQVRQSKEC